MFNLKDIIVWCFIIYHFSRFSSMQSIVSKYKTFMYPVRNVHIAISTINTHNNVVDCMQQSSGPYVGSIMLMLLLREFWFVYCFISGVIHCSSWLYQLALSCSLVVKYLVVCWIIHLLIFRHLMVSLSLLDCYIYVPSA